MTQDVIPCAPVEAPTKDTPAARRFAACTPIPLRRYWDGEDAMPAESGVARVGTNDEGLAFFIEFEDSDLYCEATANQQRMWTLGDVAEIFIKPGRERQDYWEIHITPNDFIMDIRIADRERFMGGEITWEQVIAADSGTRWQVRETETGWTVEAVVPWAAFDLPAHPAGSIWQIAICRYNCNGSVENPELSSTAAFTQAGFHRYEEYTDIKL